MPYNYIELDDDVWADTYKVREDVDTLTGGSMFETYGKDFEYVRSLDERYVWTYLSGDGDCIVNGLRFVNRLGYYVTELPWNDDDYIYIDLEGGN